MYNLAPVTSRWTLFETDTDPRRFWDDKNGVTLDEETQARQVAQIVGKSNQVKGKGLFGQGSKHFQLSANSEMQPEGGLPDQEGELPREENYTTFNYFLFLFLKIGNLKIKWPKSEEKMENEGRLGQRTNIFPST